MAAHGCVLVGEHTREMVGSTRNNDDFDFANYYFDYDDKFDCAYYDHGCAAYGDNNDIYDYDIYDYDIDDYDIDDYDIDDYDIDDDNVA